MEDLKTPRTTKKNTKAASILAALAAITGAGLPKRQHTQIHPLAVTDHVSVKRRKHRKKRRQMARASKQRNRR